MRVPCSVFGASRAATSTAANLQHSTVGMDPKVCRLSSVVCNARERGPSTVAHHRTEQDAKDAVEPAEAYAASTRGSGCECTIGRASGRECEGCYYTRLGVRIRWNGRVQMCVQQLGGGPSKAPPSPNATCSATWPTSGTIDTSRAPSSRLPEAPARLRMA